LPDLPSDVTVEPLEDKCNLLKHEVTLKPMNAVKVAVEMQATFASSREKFVLHITSIKLMLDRSLTSITKMLMIYRSTPVQSTRCSPSKLLIGRELKRQCRCCQETSVRNGQIWNEYPTMSSYQIYATTLSDEKLE